MVTIPGLLVVVLVGLMGPVAAGSAITAEPDGDVGTVSPRLPGAAPAGLVGELGSDRKAGLDGLNHSSHVVGAPLVRSEPSSFVLGAGLDVGLISSNLNST